MLDKILYCYNPNVRLSDQLETRAFLKTSNFNNIVEYCNISAGRDVYPRRVLDNIGKYTFINIEMDIVPTDDIISEIAACEHPLCVAQYMNNLMYLLPQDVLDELVKNYCEGMHIDKDILSSADIKKIEDIFTQNQFFPTLLHRKLTKQNIEMDFSDGYLSRHFRDIIKTAHPLRWTSYDDEFAEVPALGLIKFDKSIKIEEPDLSALKSCGRWQNFDGTLGKYFLKMGISAHIHKYIVKHNHYYLGDEYNNITTDINHAANTVGANI